VDRVETRRDHQRPDLAPYLPPSTAAGAFAAIVGYSPTGSRREGAVCAPDAVPFSALAARRPDVAPW
jgi:hypothetical protein